MATSVTAKIDLKVRCTEEETGAGITTTAQTSTRPHNFEISSKHVSGTGSNQQDLVYSVSATATGAADTYDVAGSLSSVLTGDAWTAVEITAIGVRNKSSSSGETLTVGAGSNPLLNWVNASGDAVVVGPGGFFWISSPLDGYAVVAGTGDVITIDPGADTISYDLILLGRSA